jgi:hypothetical protein
MKNDDTDTEILPCISYQELYDGHDECLRYPVLGAFMGANARELRTHQEYWNRSSFATRLRIVEEEREIIENYRKSQEKFYEYGMIFF